MCLCVRGVSSDFSEHVSVRWTWKAWPELSSGWVPWGCSVLGGVPEGILGDSPFCPHVDAGAHPCRAAPSQAPEVPPGLCPPARRACRHPSRSSALGVGPRPVCGGLCGCPVSLVHRHMSLASEFPQRRALLSCKGLEALKCHVVPTICLECHRPGTEESRGGGSQGRGSSADAGGRSEALGPAVSSA